MPLSQAYNKMLHKSQTTPVVGRPGKSGVPRFAGGKGYLQCIGGSLSLNFRIGSDPSQGGYG